MSVEDLVKLIDAITKFLGVLAWPALVGYVLIRFEPALRDFFESLGEFSLKGAGFEASAKRMHAEAAAALTAAAAAKSGSEVTPESTAREAREAADVVAETVTPRILRKAKRATVLWVDDRPDNNLNERRSLEALGVSFLLARSTDEAIEILQRRRVDVIISDMGRPPDPRAGYTLLSRLKNSGDTTPFVIYAGSANPEHREAARRAGARDSTNRASELFKCVLSALWLEA